MALQLFFANISMGITIGLLIPLLGTMLGASFVFFMKKDMSPKLQKSLLGRHHPQLA